MSTYKLDLHCYTSQLLGVATNTLVKPFLLQNHSCLAHKSTAFYNNALLSAIIHEMGGPLREEQAVNRKLKSHLVWPIIWLLFKLMRLDVYLLVQTI